MYKPLVVLANSKSILNTKYAPKEIRNNTIRVDQLVEYIKKDLMSYDKDLISSQKSMLEMGNSFLEANVTEYNSIANKYNKNEKIVNKEDLIEQLKNFRKEKSKEMGVPAYYVFNDEELDKIIEVMPKTVEELKPILIPIKIKVHGENIINIVNK